MAEPWQPPTLPLEDPVLIFGVAMIVFLVMPLFLERYRLPGMVGIIVVGAAIGPNGLYFLERDATIVLLGQVGLVYLMFVAGLEINLDQFIASREKSIVFGFLSFAVPQAVGTAVGVAAFGLTLPAALLFASIFASHTLLAYPIVNRLDVTDNEAITATIGGTILTDTLALLVLAVVVATETGRLGPAFWLQLSVSLVVFFAGVWVIVPRIGRWFFRNLSEESYFEFLFVMSVLFVCAYLATFAGIEAIVGAFLAGLVLNRLVPANGTLMNRVEFVGNALFIPFFLLSIGMLVDVRVVFETPRSVVIGGSLVVMTLVTKYVAAWLTGRYYGFSRDEIAGMFGLSLGQAAAALAIVLVAFETGVPGFGQEMINAVVLLILAASLLSPVFVERAGNAILEVRELSRDDPDATPHRILVPFSQDAHYGTRLLDVALALRAEGSTEPLYTVTVVQHGRDVDVALAAAESSLRDFEAYVSAAEVPIETQTRVAHSPASGIVRTAVENRITTIVIGWDGARSRRQAAFGSTIDQVLRQTEQLVFVVRAREPVNTSRRLVVLVPPGIEYNPGIQNAVSAINRLARGVGASIHAVEIGDDRGESSGLFGGTNRVSTTTERTPDWKSVLTVLRDDIRRDDLVICLSSRRDRPGWNPKLQTLPKSISTLVSGNFVIVYPATDDRRDQRQFFRVR